MKVSGITTRTLAALFFATLPVQGGPGKVEIRLTLSPDVGDAALSGRVFVMFDRDVYSQPMDRRRPSEASPWFAAAVEDWTAGSTLVLGEETVGYPFQLTAFPPGDYVVQAVLDCNANEIGISDEPGNLYSDALAASVHGDSKKAIYISLDHVIAGKPLRQTAFLREFKLRSERLTAFHDRPVDLKAAVLLPPSYFRDPDRHYATVYVLPGFGSPYETIFAEDFHRRRYGMNLVGEEKLFVFLDQECPLGYHVYADSDNNGPWSTALVEDLIPQIEKEFRVYPDPETRFLMGQSSGAWAGLWLQITHPDQFGGVWALSPDPVDFRSFIGVDIYEKGVNFFRDAKGETRELNTRLSAIDRVFGDGWAVSTFEAVFSPPDGAGHPRRLWNRDTGVIDSSVADAWKRYDLRLVLQENWSALAPRLAGKIHILVAEDDPFGLCPPVRMLAEAMAAFDHDMEIVILPDGGHDLWSDELRQRIHGELDEVVRDRVETRP